MSLITWEPFREYDRALGDQIFPTVIRPITFDLAVDVYEEQGNVVAKMSLPGLQAEDVDVSVDDDTLTVSGRRAEETETKEKEYYSKEIRRGSFSRTVALPRSVQAEKANAQFQDGILVVTLPVVEDSKDKAVKVNVST